MGNSVHRDKINTSFGYSSSFKGYPKTGISRLRGNDLVQIDEWELCISIEIMLPGLV